MDIIAVLIVSVVSWLLIGHGREMARRHKIVRSESRALDGEIDFLN